MLKEFKVTNSKNTNIKEFITVGKKAKIYNKSILFLYAALSEIVSAIRKENPSIDKRIINTMSINMKNYIKKYDDPEKDLGWKQNTDREFILNKLDSWLNRYL